MPNEAPTQETALLEPVAGVAHEALRLERDRLRERGDRLQELLVEERAKVKAMRPILQEIAAGTTKPRHLRKLAGRTLARLGR